MLESLYLALRELSLVRKRQYRLLNGAVDRVQGGTTCALRTGRVLTRGIATGYGARSASFVRAGG